MSHKLVKRNSDGSNLKLNNNGFGQPVLAHGYELDPTKKYIICLDDEMETQAAIMQAISIMGCTALTDYWDWLKSNGFSVDFPNPTNEFVSKYYGVKPLWKTDLSQGIVVKNVGDDDFYIVMECSRNVEGYKYTQVIMTLGGCI